MRGSLAFRSMLLLFAAAAAAVLAGPNLSGAASPCPQTAELRCPPPCDPAACPTPCSVIDPCPPEPPCVTLSCIRDLACDKLQLCMVCPMNAYACPPPCYQTAYYCPPPCYVVEGDGAYVCTIPCPQPLICVQAKT